MIQLQPSALASAAETRRRELPASMALTILTGGLAAAIMGGGAPVGWAAVVSLLLVFDTEIYRRLDLNVANLDARAIALLAAWSFFASAFYAVLPVALWLHGAAASAAAAMVLWVAGVVRHCSRGASGAWQVALAGAAPPALSLLCAPLLLAGMSRHPDWDLALIAAVGGGALMAYVVQARVSAQDAETALRDAAQARHMQHTMAQLLFEHGSLAAMLLDRDGRIVAMSATMARGLGVADGVGLKFEEITPWSPTHWRNAFARALGGETVRYEEDQTLTAQGMAWYNWEARPWRSDDGAICGVIAHGSDITSLVQSRTAAAENEARLTLALQAGHSVVWEVDFKTRAIAWHGDPVPLYGGPIGFAEFIDNTTPVLHEDDRAPLKAYFESVIGGFEGSIEHRVQRGGGQLGWVQVSAKRVAGRSGATRKLIVLSKDITERKQRERDFIAAMHRAESALRAKRVFGEAGAEAAPFDEAVVNTTEMHERLDGLIAEMNVRDAALAESVAALRAAREAAEAASLSKSQFLTSMSHELRTPLNAIIGYSEMLHEEAEADGRANDMADIERVLASARQLLHLINDILDLSKIEAGRMDVAAAEFDVAALIEDAAATVRPAAAKNGNALRLDLAPDLGAARSDAFKLTQCLLNLLSNAAKFTNAGEIAVTARRETRDAGDWIEIAVSDTGVGMSSEQLARVFDAFEQADATTARRFGGTGLGLAITRRIVQLLGGDVAASSELGKGAVFRLSLPAQYGAACAPERIDAAAAAGRGCERIVLVIDDEENARELIGRSLARLGFVVRGARDGEEGLMLARKLAPSLIMLDIRLPDLSGWDVLAALAAAPETAAVPVIVHSVEDCRQRALGLGACDLLVKPADRDVLAAAALRFARAPDIPAPAEPAVSTIARSA